ncbi:MAG: ABC transporter permease, partial [Bacteroidota bacterium]
MDKLGLIIWREYLAKVRNKSFIIMTILSPLLIVGMIILIAYLTKINDSESRIIAVLDQSTFFEDKFKPSTAISYVHFEDIDLEAAQDSVKALQYDGLLFIPNAANVDLVAQNTFFYSEDNPSTGTTGAMESIIQGVLREKRMQNLGVSNSTFQKIEKEFNLKLASFDGGVNLKGVNEMKAFIGGAFGYAIMMFIIIYGGFVMRSVIEEKT